MQLPVFYLKEVQNVLLYSIRLRILPEAEFMNVQLR
jgi:hypothetical protein